MEGVGAMSKLTGKIYSYVLIVFLLTVQLYAGTTINVGIGKVDITPTQPMML